MVGKSRPSTWIPDAKKLYRQRAYAIEQSQRGMALTILPLDSVLGGIYFRELLGSQENPRHHTVFASFGALWAHHIHSPTS